MASVINSLCTVFLLSDVMNLCMFEQRSTETEWREGIFLSVAFLDCWPEMLSYDQGLSKDEIASIVHPASIFAPYTGAGM